MDYQYQTHGGYDGTGQCDEMDDYDNDETDYYYNSRNSWQACNEESPDDPYDPYRNEDAFEDETQRPSSTTFFEGASNFVIDGGSFISNSGGNYADFEWESEPIPTLSSPLSKSVFFKGSSDFVISGGHLDSTKEDSTKYCETNRPRKKSREQGEKRPVGALSKPRSELANPLKGRSTLRKFSSGPTPTFPEPDLQVASIHTSYDPHCSQDEANTLPTRDDQIVDVDMPAPILISHATPLEDEYRSNDHRIIKKRNRVKPPECPKSEYSKIKITSDPQMHSTTAKLKKLSLRANSGSYRNASTQRSQGRDHNTDHFPPFSMPQPRARVVDPSPIRPSPKASTSSMGAFGVNDLIHQEARLGSTPFLLDRSYPDNPVLESQPPELTMPQPVRFPDPKRLTE